MTETYAYPRVPKLGRRHTDKTRPLVALDLTGVVPDHPATADHLSAVPTWNGDTNFNYGTCGPCDCANSIIACYKYLLGQDISVSDDAIFNLYRRSGNPNFDPATDADDNGVDMTVMLSALVKGGITITHPGGGTELVKPYLFGTVPLDVPSFQATTAIMGGVTMASTLDVAQQNQTGNGNWDYVAGSGVWGGHATYGGLYLPQAGAHDLLAKLVTWQQPQGFTTGFYAHQVEQLFVIIWPPLWDHPAFQAGYDQPAMVAAFEAITHRKWTGPPPVPAPTPPPPGPLPAPHPDDEADTAFAKVLLTQNTAGVPWVGQRHGSFNATVAREGRAWLVDRGFAAGGAPAGTAPNDYPG